MGAMPIGRPGVLKSPAMDAALQPLRRLEAIAAEQYAAELAEFQGVKLAAKSGVISDLEAGGTYAGVPAMPHRMWLKVSALTMKLPEIWKALRER